MTNKHHTTCLLCQSQRLISLKQFKKDYLVQCQHCGFVFCQRIPSQEELMKHYKQYVRGGNISSITIKRYQSLLDEFEKYRKTNNILDIGCGDGYFLEEAKKKAWNVFGTEFTDEAIAVCKTKQIKINQGILNIENYQEQMFDVITSFEVMEHINNPVEEVNKICYLLRNKGVFYFTTPNFNSFSRYWLKEQWSIIEYPEHLSYYTKKTIKNLLISNNLNKVFLKTHGLSSIIFKKDKTCSSLQITKSNDENIRIEIENSNLKKLIKCLVNWLLDLTSKGDTIKGLFVKQ